MPTLLTRSGDLSLSLFIDGKTAIPYCNNISRGVPLLTDGWLCEQTLRRTVRVSITHLPDVYYSHFMPFFCCRMPVLEDFESHVDPRKYTARTNEIGPSPNLPTNIFAHHAPHLRRVSLSNVTFSWSSVIAATTLTCLDLNFHIRLDELHACTPSAWQFQRIISSLTSLKRLILHGILPTVSGDSPGPRIALPQSLEYFSLEHSSCDLLDQGSAFFECLSLPRSTAAVVSVPWYRDTDEDDETDDELAPYAACLFGTIDGTRTDGELHISNDVIVRQPSNGMQMRALKHTPDLISDWWTPHLAPGGRSLQIHDGFDNAWNNMDIVRRYLALPTVQTVVCSYSAAYLENASDWTSSLWTSNLEDARNVQNLSVAYGDPFLSLFEALLVVANPEDGTGQFTLFPRLSTIALHIFDCEGSLSPEEHDTQLSTLDGVVLEMLRARKQAGAPVKELLVVEELAERDVWKHARELVNVTVFERVDE